MNFFPIFENRYYMMREMNISDVKDIFEYCSDRNLMRYTGSPVHKSIEDTEEMIQRLSISYIEGNSITWAIAEKSKKKVIGNIGLRYKESNRNIGIVNYNIHSSYQNQGIATWALHKCLQYGLNELNLNRIEAKCKSVNIASERVMQKCGMHLSDVKKSPFLVDGIYYDIKTYYLSK